MRSHQPPNNRHTSFVLNGQSTDWSLLNQKIHAAATNDTINGGRLVDTPLVVNNSPTGGTDSIIEAHTVTPTQSPTFVSNGFITKPQLEVVDFTSADTSEVVYAKVPQQIYEKLYNLHVASLYDQSLHNPVTNESISLYKSNLANQDEIQHTIIHDDNISHTTQKPTQIHTKILPTSIQSDQQPQTPSTPITPQLPSTTNPSSSSKPSRRRDMTSHIRGSWTEEEDNLLISLVKEHGPKRWSFIASHLKGRIGKQCRERYLNHLDPHINKGEWTPEEDDIILQSHSEFGNQWAKIAKQLTGRTANAVKNHWNSTLKRRLDPEFHASRTPSKPSSKKKISRKKSKPEDSSEHVNTTIAEEVDTPPDNNPEPENHLLYDENAAHSSSRDHTIVTTEGLFSYHSTSANTFHTNEDLFHPFTHSSDDYREKPDHELFSGYSQKRKRERGEDFDLDNSLEVVGKRMKMDQVPPNTSLDKLYAGAPMDEDSTDTELQEDDVFHSTTGVDTSLIHSYRSHMTMNDPSADEFPLTLLPEQHTSPTSSWQTVTNLGGGSGGGGVIVERGSMTKYSNRYNSLMIDVPTHDEDQASRLNERGATQSHVDMSLSSNTSSHHNSGVVTSSTMNPASGGLTTHTSHSSSGTTNVISPSAGSSIWISPKNGEFSPARKEFLFLGRSE